MTTSILSRNCGLLFSKLHGRLPCSMSTSPPMHGAAVWQHRSFHKCWPSSMSRGATAASWNRHGGPMKETCGEADRPADPWQMRLPRSRSRHSQAAAAQSRGDHGADSSGRGDCHEQQPQQQWHQQRQPLPWRQHEDDAGWPQRLQQAIDEGASPAALGLKHLIERHHARPLFSRGNAPALNASAAVGWVQTHAHSHQR